VEYVFGGAFEVARVARRGARLARDRRRRRPSGHARGSTGIPPGRIVGFAVAGVLGVYMVWKTISHPRRV